MHTTREQWLNHMAQLLGPVFSGAGYPLPSNIRFSCGWPGCADRQTRIGECWHSKSSADGTFEIFISPTLSDPLRVGDVLVLRISEERYITFLDEWVERLRTLPYDQYGDVIRSTVYPALSETDRRIWNRSTISNRDLHNAIQAFR
jgi:hypothetical protein